MRPDELACDREFDPLGAGLTHVIERTGVVNQHVDFRVAPEQVGCCGAKRYKVAGVGDHKAHVRVAGVLSQRRADGCGLRPVARNDLDGRTHPGQCPCGLRADAGRSAGDDNDAARKVPSVKRRPMIEPSPQRGPDTGKAADDAPFEGGVEGPGGGAHHAATFCESTRLKPSAARSPMNPNASRNSGSNRASGPLSVSVAS